MTKSTIIWTSFNGNSSDFIQISSASAFPFAFDMAETDPEIKNPNTSRYLTEEDPNLFN